MNERIREFVYKAVEKIVGPRREIPIEPPRVERDLSPSPFAQVWFKTPLEHARASRIIDALRPTQHFPGPSAVVNVAQLYALKDAGIEVWPEPEVRARGPKFDKPHDIDETIQTLRRVGQLIEEGKSLRDYL